jgi:hypothetical protein
MREEGETAANSPEGDDVVLMGEGRAGRNEGRFVPVQATVA